MSLGKRLREARESAGLTQQQVGDLFGTSRVAVAKWESDSNAPESDKLSTLARRLNRSVDFLLTGRESRSSGNTEIGPDIKGKVPLISWVQAGSWAAIADNFQPGDAEEWVGTTVPIHQHTFALRVRGDSMTNPAGEPSFPDGAVIIVEPDAVNGLETMLNQFVIVKRAADDEATFKRLVKDAGRYYLKPLNPQYPMLDLREDDVFCGVVRERVMRFF